MTSSYQIFIIPCWGSFLDLRRSRDAYETDMLPVRGVFRTRGEILRGPRNPRERMKGSRGELPTVITSLWCPNFKNSKLGLHFNNSLKEAKRWEVKLLLAAFSDLCMQDVFICLCLTCGFEVAAKRILIEELRPSRVLSFQCRSWLSKVTGVLGIVVVRSNSCSLISHFWRLIDYG